jgi:hypothetical protein
MPREGTVAGPNGTLIAPAGIEWDAIKVPRFVGLPALKGLKPGSVLVDPAPSEPALYFFVAPGTAANWRAPQSTALGATTSVVLPPRSWQAPPGPYWLIPPAADQAIRLTARDALHKALAAQRDERLPVAIETMRTAADKLLADNASFPRYDDLADTTDRLRAHLLLLLPLVEDAAGALPSGNTTKACVLATLENTRVRLMASPGPGLVSATQLARSLARELRALCGHYETLIGAAVGEPR